MTSDDPLLTNAKAGTWDTSSRFLGPLFVVGMPRSGTKLLRAILNRHSRIAIPLVETEFLPWLVQEQNRFGDLSRADNFQRFYRRVSVLPYFHYQRQMGSVIGPETWRVSCRRFDPAGIFEALIRHDADAPLGSPTIWGDKSPSYIRHLPLLRRLFPSARIIHIVRDVRDYCLSVRAAWGKSMLRAAQRWADDVSAARADGSALGPDYTEVRYEDLLRAPDTEITRLCQFLGVEFEDQMLVVPGDTESLGAAKGQRRIVATNMNKFRSQMSPKLRSRIEAIGKPVLESLGYPIEYEGEPQVVGKLPMGVLRMVDALNLLFARRKHTQTLRSIAIDWNHFQASGRRRG